MGAFHNALREEGTRAELLAELERQWATNERLVKALKEIERLDLHDDGDGGTWAGSTAEIARAALHYRFED